MLQTNFDIIIIGAGSAGTAAAVAAAELNKKVLVIEKQAFAGGKATAAEVGTICGLFHQGNYTTPKWLAAGFARKFAEQFILPDLSNILSSDEGLHFIQYSKDDFRQRVENEFNTHSVEIWFGCDVVKVNGDKNQITSIVVSKENKEIELTAVAFVDCSGNACVNQLIDEVQITADFYQAASRVFTLSGFNISDEKVLSLLIWRSIARGIKDGFIPNYLSQVFIVQGSLKNSTVNFKLTIPIQVTHTRENLEQLDEKSVEMIQVLVNYLQSQTEFSSINLDSIATEVGVRTGPRPIGKRMLTGDDVLHLRKATDTIARASWPIEKWSVDRKVELIYLPDNDFYDIPVGCLISPHMKNLFFAGRMIAADETAIASARVMGVCLQTGYAAGCLAAYLINGKSQDEAVRYIQSKQILS